MIDDHTYEVSRNAQGNTTVSVEAVKGITKVKSVLAALR
jgi:hypothetical protein